jgi:hypothetical protein
VVNRHGLFARAADGRFSIDDDYHVFPFSITGGVGPRWSRGFIAVRLFVAAGTVMHHQRGATLVMSDAVVAPDERAPFLPEVVDKERCATLRASLVALVSDASFGFAHLLNLFFFHRERN